MEARATQLAESRPQLDFPLRVGIPINAPERRPKPKSDDIIRANTFSPQALAISKKNQANLAAFGESLIDSPNKTPVNTEHNALVATSIKDFTVLALSSKRADKKEVEATAYASLGVIYDDQSNNKLAIENYELYLAICEDINDTIGIACACNCIGVDYMNLANPAGSIFSIQLNDDSVAHLNKALSYHSRHLEIGPDPGAQFVANTNMGLCLAMLGNINQAAKHHQDALRVAIKMQTLYGQSISVGNLGMLAVIRSDYSTAKTCFDQHLQLVQALADYEAEINAWKLLANLYKLNENHIDALDALGHARAIAEREGFLNDLRRINCLIGVTQGTLDFFNFSSSLLEQEQML
jgi:tetratricopeptide (TPR) repeat protein